MKIQSGHPSNKKVPIPAKRILAAAGLVAALYTACHAATYTWTGTSSSTWSTAGNWTPTCGTPNSGSTGIMSATVTAGQTRVVQFEKQQSGITGSVPSLQEGTVLWLKGNQR